MALGDVIARLSVVLGLDTAAFEKGATIAEKRLSQTQRKFEQLGDRMSGLGTKLSIGLTAPLTAFGVSAFNAASDAAELQSAFDQTFGDMSDEMNRWAVETGDAMGRSTQSIQEMANTFGIFFNQAAPTRKEAAEMSKTFSVLAQDLSSFYNVSESDALQKLRSGLSGESEPLRDFGVFLSEAAVQSKAMELGLTGVGDELTEQEKILARYQLILENTANAQGDVARTSDGTANQLRKSQAAFEELQVAVGTKLLPVITPLITRLGELLTAFSSLPDGVQTTVVAGAALAAALGPVLLTVGSLIKLGAPLLALVQTVGTAMAATGSAAGAMNVAFAALRGGLAVLVPALAPLAAIAAVAALVYANWDKIAPVLQEFWEAASEALGPPLQSLIAALSTLFSELWNGPLGDGIRLVIDAFFAFQKAYLEALGPPLIAVIKAAILVLTAFVENLVDGVRLVSAVLQGDWQTAFQAAWDIVNRMFAGVPRFVIDAMQKMVAGIRTWVVGKLGAIWDGVVKKIESVKRAFFNLYDAVVGNSYVPDMVDGIADQMRRLDQVMVAQAERATDATADTFRDLRDLLDRLFPEQARAVQYGQEKALIAGGVAAGSITPMQGLLAQQRLYAERFPEQTEALDQTVTGLASAFANLKIAGVDAFDAVGSAAGSATDRLSEGAERFRQFGEQAFGSLMYQVEGFLLGAQSALDVVKNLVSQLASAAFRQFVVSPLGSALGIPGFANGTSFAPGGLALVGERGPELVNLPRGSQVIPNNELGFGRGAGGPTFNITVNGAMSDDAARRTGTQIGSAAARQFAMARRTGLAG